MVAQNVRRGTVYRVAFAVVVVAKVALGAVAAVPALERVARHFGLAFAVFVALGALNGASVAVGSLRAVTVALPPLNGA